MRSRQWRIYIFVPDNAQTLDERYKVVTSAVNRARSDSGHTMMSGEVEHQSNAL